MDNEPTTKRIAVSRFALATLSTKDGHQVAINVDDKFYLLDDVAHSGKSVSGKTVAELLQEWPNASAYLETVADGIHQGGESDHALSADDIDLMTPVRFPPKVICVGANYGGHLKEMGLPPTKWTPMPYFLRPPTTSLVGPGRTVRKPRMTKQFDWEVELVVVLGKSLRHARTVDDAADAIAGYSIGLDLSCRDLQMVKDFGMDIGRGKAQDTLAPCGPVLVPKQFLPKGTSNLALKLWVNGQQMVDGTTADMLYSPEEQLLELSKFMTLEPGDLVFTGAPAGSAKANGGRWLQAGDQIKAEIEDVGILEVEVREDD